MSFTAVGTRGWAFGSVGRGGQAAAAALILCASLSARMAHMLHDA